ncbi:N-acylethanolamine-hydrolyzing acid amidase [Fulvia fulva]|nr:N-acylethanolamine-hydrolyzing acid amidase [Fulvia fulva]KAK4622439.1 N-acylethanolamine-hydrolyzing acid amidase [Fulvia fulva]WPV16055.1 N-acylethanolamine-hydrolyzing acid amidase [Fulvia fulva]
MPPATRSQTVRQTVAHGYSASPSRLTDQEKAENNVRLREQASGYTSRATSQSSTRSARSKAPDEPPRFVINLSLPPEQRYLEVCEAFKDQIRGLTPLSDEVVGDMASWLPLKGLHRMNRTFLSGVRDGEENRELKGISKATGVDMYLLVCFNVLLDLFMGCSSGGAAISDGNGGSKMVHFRTLDCGMPSLRKIVVQLDFIPETDGPTIASCITYAGYVGILTGVRKDFSVSLNFRPNRLDKYKFWSDTRYYWHLAMVLLGRRRSVSSELRSLLLPTKIKAIDTMTGRNGSALTTTACYLCFSDGTETTVIEKDRATAVFRSSNDFIVITNNDLDHEDEKVAEAAQRFEDERSPFVSALAEIVEEGKDRRLCAHHNYHNMRKQQAKHIAASDEDSLRRVLNVDDIVKMVQRYPTTNETTHYACVMDPTQGDIKWCRRWVKPVTSRWTREHASNDY